MQRTFALLKPEAVFDRNICIAIITLIMKNGFTIRILEQLSPSHDKVEAHYFLHENKPYFNDLVNDIAGQQVVAMVLEHEDDAVALWRRIMGPYQEEERNKLENAMSIRAQFMQRGSPLRTSFCHGADSVEAAEREIALWFPGYPD